MKMAEALMERADLLKRIAGLQVRIEASALVQEGDAPAENPVDLMGEQEAAMEDLSYLIARINLRNAVIELPDGKLLTRALAERDRLDKQMKLLRKTIEAARGGPHARLYGRRASRTEIKDVATVDIATLNKRLDALAAERREVDRAIQEANWREELAP